MVRTCIAVKKDGIQCGSPAWRTYTRCWHHEGGVRRAYVARRGPAIDTPEGRVKAIDHVFQAILRREITPTEARALLYALQVSMQVPVAQDLADNPFDLNILLESLKPK
ncbi:MAG TPA: hypothetical protein VMZ25_03465 [Terriglobales bacterium]|nr:hypothetical protein [Terriglobales bacterium]